MYIVAVGRHRDFRRAAAGLLERVPTDARVRGETRQWWRRIRGITSLSNQGLRCSSLPAEVICDSSSRARKSRSQSFEQSFGLPEDVDNVSALSRNHQEDKTRACVQHVEIVDT